LKYSLGEQVFPSGGEYISKLQWIFLVAFLAQRLLCYS
jgi:hypothetical protein